jgi:hypothetical protein
VSKSWFVVLILFCKLASQFQLEGDSTDDTFSISVGLSDNWLVSASSTGAIFGTGIISGTCEASSC